MWRLGSCPSQSPCGHQSQDPFESCPAGPLLPHRSHLALSLLCKPAQASKACCPLRCPWVPQSVCPMQLLALLALGTPRAKNILATQGRPAQSPGSRGGHSVPVCDCLLLHVCSVAPHTSDFFWGPSGLRNSTSTRLQSWSLGPRCHLPFQAYACLEATHGPSRSTQCDSWALAGMLVHSHFLLNVNDSACSLRSCWKNFRTLG